MTNLISIGGTFMMSAINDRVAYEPLGTSAKLDGEELHGLDCDPDIDEDPFSGHPIYDKRQNGIPLLTSSLLSLRHLRMFLYLIAMVLLILFIAQLFSSKPADSISLSIIDNTGVSAYTPQLRKEPTPALTSKLFHLTANTSSPQSTAADYTESPRPQSGRPKYDGYLTSVLQERNSHQNQDRPISETIDDFQLPNENHQPQSSLKQELAGTKNSSDVTGPWWLLGQRNSNKHVTVTNYIRAMKSFSYSDSVTLTTQATTEFMYHTLELCIRWDGPISVSVFCPGIEMSVAITLIKYMRQCLPVPLSACIRDKVTWHIVYNTAHGPPKDALGFPKTHLDSQHYPLFVNQDQCPKLAGPQPSDTIRQFESALRKSNGILSSSYRQQFNIPYPINVLRNTARQAAETEYVLASDVELYPSIDLVPMFIKYIKAHNFKKELSDTAKVNKFVFTLPIFEVKSNVTAPKTKRELIELINQNNAIFFHKWVCDECQNFPNRLDWLQTDRFGAEDYHSNDELVIFEVTQRDRSKHSWEPIFIGTNEDPPYDDRLTWDGRRDKMAQMYEMCLQDYHLLVLGNAFLVHAPGIKHIDREDVKKRLNYIIENNSLYDRKMSSLKQQYSDTGNSHKC